MMKQVLSIGIIALGLILSTSAVARPAPGNHNYTRPTHLCVSGNQIDKRQANQKKSMKRGIRKGSIFQWEISQLKKQMRLVRKAEKGYRLSGRCLTGYEQQQLNYKLDRIKVKMQQYKNNNFSRQTQRQHRRNRNRTDR